MKAGLELGFGYLDRLFSIVNSRQRAYTLILLWTLSALSYGVFKLTSVETIEHFILLNKCRELHEHGRKHTTINHSHDELKPPIVGNN